jgi:hypothetical protein
MVIYLSGTCLASEPLLQSIRFEKSTTCEKVFFKLNGFYPPGVFTLTGDQPRIVCDFKKVNLEKSFTQYLKTDGTFVLLIRVGIYHPPDPKIRVVLDLSPKKNYTIEQIFFQKDTTFALIIRPEHADKK